MFNAKFSITNKMLKDIGIIEASREVIETSNITEFWLEKFTEQRKNYSLISNLTLEGFSLEEDDLQDVLEKEDSDFLKRLVKNIDEAQDFIDSIYKKLGPNNPYLLTKETLLQIHIILSQGINPMGGKIRSSEVVIKKSETGEISFTPPPSAETPYLIEDLIDWINQEEAQDIHPIIKAAIIQLEIIRIHPFVNFTNIVARLISDLIIFLEGYSLKETLCPEQKLSEDILKYHNILHFIFNQDVLDNHERDLTSWIEYFVSIIAEESLDIKDKFKRLSQETMLKDKLGDKVEINERQLLIIDFLKKNKEMRNKDFRKIFPDFSDDTVLREIKFMKKKGLIEKQGGTKNAVYVLAKNS